MKGTAMKDLIETTVETALALWPYIWVHEIETVDGLERKKTDAEVTDSCYGMPWDAREDAPYTYIFKGRTYIRGTNKDSKVMISLTNYDVQIAELQLKKAKQQELIAEHLSVS
jgi:hypothetical protein